MVGLGSEQQIRARLALAAFCILPFGVGLWNFFDPVGPAGPRLEVTVRVEELLKPFTPGSDLDAVAGSVHEAFRVLDEAYGPDSPYHALALLRRGQLGLYRVDLREAERDLREAARRGGCAEVGPTGEPAGERSRTYSQGGLFDIHCAEAWGKLSEVLRENQQIDEGLRYLRAHLATKRAVLGTGPEILHDLQARSLRRALEEAADVMRTHGRPEEAAELLAESRGVELPR